MNIYNPNIRIYATNMDRSVRILSGRIWKINQSIHLDIRNELHLNLSTSDVLKVHGDPKDLTNLLFLQVTDSHFIICGTLVEFNPLGGIGSVRNIVTSRIPIQTFKLNDFGLVCHSTIKFGKTFNTTTLQHE